jgi:hypothetical protein
MATLMFFEESLYDQSEREDRPVEIEIGQSTFSGDGLVYISFNGHSWHMEKEAGRRFCKAMEELAAKYLAENPEPRKQGRRERWAHYR